MMSKTCCCSRPYEECCGLLDTVYFIQPQPDVPFDSADIIWIDPLLVPEDGDTMEDHLREIIGGLIAAYLELDADEVEVDDIPMVEQREPSDYACQICGCKYDH